MQRRLIPSQKPKGLGSAFVVQMHVASGEMLAWWHVGCLHALRFDCVLSSSSESFARQRCAPNCAPLGPRRPARAAGDWWLAMSVLGYRLGSQPSALAGSFCVFARGICGPRTNCGPHAKQLCTRALTLFGASVQAAFKQPTLQRFEAETNQNRHWSVRRTATMPIIDAQASVLRPARVWGW